MQQLAFDHRVAGKYETFILIWIKTIILLKRAFPQNKIIERRMNCVDAQYQKKQEPQRC